MRKRYYFLIFLILGAGVAWYMFGYNFQKCQNNIFSIYKKGIADGPETFYDFRTKEKLGSCGFWVGEPCKTITEQAGKCEATNPVNFYFHKWF